MAVKGTGSGAPVPRSHRVLPSRLRRLLLVGSPGFLAAHRCGLPCPGCLPAVLRGAAAAGRVLLGPDPAPLVPGLRPPPHRHPQGAFQRGHAGLLQPRLPPLLLLSCPGGTFVFLNPGYRNNLLIKCINS